MWETNGASKSVHLIVNITDSIKIPPGPRYTEARKENTHIAGPNGVLGTLAPNLDQINLLGMVKYWQNRGTNHYTPHHTAVHAD